MEYLQSFFHKILFNVDSLFINRIFITTFTLISALFFSTEVNASQKILQSLDSIAFEKIKPEDGLSYFLVSDIEQDHMGFMWFGTDYGLNRYNGYEIQIFSYDSNQPNLAKSNITSLQMDIDGYLWIGTKNNGLSKIDTTTFETKVYHHNPENPNSIASEEVGELFLDSKNRLWVGLINGGLALYNRKQDSFQHYFHDPDDETTLGSNNVSAIDEDAYGNLWIGFLGKGFINRFNPETGNIKRIVEYYFDPTSKNNELSVPDVLSLRVDQDGVVNFGTWAFGYFRYDPTKDQLDRYLINGEMPEGLKSSIVMSVYSHENGLIWLGTRNDGVYLFNPKTEKFHSLRQVQGDRSTLSSDTILCYFKDSAGGIWLGTIDAGICRYDPNQNHFRHFFHNPHSNNSLNDNNVYAMSPDANGNIWIGTDGGGLNKYNPNTNKYTHYMHDPNDKNSLSSNTVISLLIDSNDNLWVGNWSGCLSKYDKENDAFIHYYENLESDTGMKGNYIRALCEDLTGNIWIGTEHEGLNRYDPVSETFFNYSADSEEPHKLTNNFIRGLLVDSDGILWIGTNDGYLQYYNPETDAISTIPKKPNDPLGYNAQIICTFLEDSKKRLWIGSDSGLFQYDKNKKIFYHYTKKDGLPHNMIKAILEDDFGYLWISTNNGTSRLDPETKTFKNFNLNDGLQGLAFTVNTCCKGENGALYFGGFNGFNRIWPRLLSENNFVPPVVITSVNVNGEKVPFHKIIKESDPLQFNHEQNFFNFEFAALNFTNPAVNQYSYRLKGLEQNWSNPDTVRNIRYTNLSPGDYVFEVKASNNDGLWNENPFQLAFTITPPFWETLWFRIGIVISILTFIHLAHSYHIRSLQERKKYLAHAVAQKTKELSEANHRLQELSFLDGLTGIANRRKFDEHCKHEWQRSTRTNQPFAVIITDIDYFKSYNDSYGHQEGDQCLIQVAHTIKSCVGRAGDLAARYGGEEFIIALSDTDLEQAYNVAEKIRHAVLDLKIYHSDEVNFEYVTLSLGVMSMIPTPHNSIDDLIEKADEALYTAKKNGRNQTIMYSKQFTLEGL